MKQAGFNPRECMEVGFTFEEGVAAGYRRHIGRDYTQRNWEQGQPPPRIEPRLTIAARALRLRALPSARRGAGRGRRRAAARAAGALRAARWRGKPALPTHARSCSWRARVAQESMPGMGRNFIDGAACPLGTAPPSRDPKSRPL
jgi:hypothetical protein